jgi:hypothetical protein
VSKESRKNSRLTLYFLAIILNEILIINFYVN